MLKEDFDEFDVAALEYDSGREHPTPEQLLIKLALEKLTAKQKTVWDLHAYAGLTEEEIGAKLGITQQAAHKALEAIETKVKKFCKLNRGAYMLLKLEQKVHEGD